MNNEQTLFIIGEKPTCNCENWRERCRCFSFLSAFTSREAAADWRSRLARVYPGMADSPITEIPRGWATSMIAELKVDGCRVSSWTSNYPGVPGLAPLRELN